MTHKKARKKSQILKHLQINITGIDQNTHQKYMIGKRLIKNIPVIVFYVFYTIEMEVHRAYISRYKSKCEKRLPF